MEEIISKVESILSLLKRAEKSEVPFSDESIATIKEFATYLEDTIDKCITMDCVKDYAKNLTISN